ncbi:hypothetical protein QBC35DRAFT_473085 [Podospora australis]|uniref:Uncharacterized protein n=1 Tax=Podospora australis TaxID=1536484 RepID=A0AAN6WVL2_9PEZI|nr:hypothetical protein QBC35DRAFT_473085 [Podospora australis]
MLRGAENGACITTSLDPEPRSKNGAFVFPKVYMNILAIFTGDEGEVTRWYSCGLGYHRPGWRYRDVPSGWDELAEHKTPRPVPLRSHSPPIDSSMRLFEVQDALSRKGPLEDRRAGGLGVGRSVGENSWIGQPWTRFGAIMKIPWPPVISHIASDLRYRTDPNRALLSRLPSKALLDPGKQTEPGCPGKPRCILGAVKKDLPSRSALPECHVRHCLLPAVSLPAGGGRHHRGSERNDGIAQESKPVCSGAERFDYPTLLNGPCVFEPASTGTYAVGAAQQGSTTKQQGLHCTKNCRVGLSDRISNPPVVMMYSLTARSRCLAMGTTGLSLSLSLSLCEVARRRKSTPYPSGLCQLFSLDRLSSSFVSGGVASAYSIASGVQHRKLVLRRGGTSKPRRHLLQIRSSVILPQYAFSAPGRIDWPASGVPSVMAGVLFGWQVQRATCFGRLSVGGYAGGVWPWGFPEHITPVRRVVSFSLRETGPVSVDSHRRTMADGCAPLPIITSICSARVQPTEPRIFLYHTIPVVMMIPSIFHCLEDHFVYQYDPAEQTKALLLDRG